jgi:hypothetical protein
MKRLLARAALVATPCIAALVPTQVTAQVTSEVTGAAAPALLDRARHVGPGSSDDVKVFALQWFEHLQAGQLDRTQMTAALSENLTDDAVEEMSRFLKSYGPATRDEIIENRKINDQAFYFLKLFLQRGDAVTLLFGFDEDGKITGVTFPSMGRE